MSDPAVRQSHRAEGQALAAEFKHYEAFVRSFLDDVPTDGASITDISRFMTWSDATGKRLNHHDLVPLDPDDSARDAFLSVSGAIGALFGKSHEDASSRSLSMQVVVKAMRWYLRHDPAPKSFIKAAELGNRKIFVAKDTTVKLLASDKDWKTAEGRHVQPWCSSVLSGIVGGNPISRPILEEKVVMLYGSSGSGKTMGAFVTAHLYNGVCALLLPDARVKEDGPLGESKVLEMLKSDQERTTAARDDAVCEYVVQRVTALVPEDSRLQPEDSTRPLVIVLDEFGNHPQLVRGVISARQSIVDRLEQVVTGRNPVWIVVAGTGVEGATHEPGTTADKYTLHRAQPLVWKHIKGDPKFVPESVQKVMADEGRPEVQLARQLVGNARACMLFVKAFQTGVLKMASDEAPVQRTPGGATQVTPLDVRFVRVAAAWAANEYKQLNALCSLSSQEHLAAMLNAVALQSVTKATDVDRERLVSNASLGLCVDRAVAEKRGSAVSLVSATRICVDSGADVNLWLQRAAEGVRYEVEPAQLAILLLLHQLGDRRTKLDSFEENTMDFLVWAVHASQECFTPQTEDKAYFQRDATTETCLTRAWRYPMSPVPNAASLSDEQLHQHHRWRYPLELIAVLRDMRDAVEKKDTPLHVLFYRAANTFRTNADLEKVVQDRNVQNGSDVAHVVLNKERAPAKDISVYMHGAVLHVQCKRFASDAISDLDVFRELYKMGNEDWRCALATVIGMKENELRETGESGSTAQSTFARLALNHLLARTFAESIEEVRAFAASDKQTKLHTEAKEIVSARPVDDAQQALQRYALMLYVGGQPAPQQPLAVELPADATVYACCRDDAEKASSDTIEAAAARLRGLYPIAIGQPRAVEGVSLPPVRR